MEQHSFFEFKSVKYILMFSLLLLSLSACDKVVQSGDPLPSRIPQLDDHTYTAFDIREEVRHHPSAQDFVRVNMAEDESDEEVSSRKSIPKITDEAAALGRVLFYDRSLSLNNRISCASCHLQEKAFSDGGAKSIGFSGKKTNRNSMAIINPAFNDNLMWDSRLNTVKELVLNPVLDHIEMGMVSVEFLEEKLATRDYYAPLFEKAYGSPEISSTLIADALTQFLCAMITLNSRWDQAQRGEVTLTDLEERGHTLFHSADTKCSSCHAGPNFAAEDFPGGEYGGSDNGAGTTNIGLERVAVDRGRSNGRFRIPSLRNIAVTGPYMHDGRFDTLEEVIQHYSEGVKNHPALDDKLIDPATGAAQKLNLNEYDRRALVVFLQTLTDETFLSDPKFSDPFTD